MRGSRDFTSVEAWQEFIDRVARKANANRGTRVAEDLAAMRELPVAKLPEYVEEDVCVSEWSTVRVKHCAYSVPSRLMRKGVRVRISEDKIGQRHTARCKLRSGRSHYAAAIAKQRLAELVGGTRSEVRCASGRRA